MILESVLGIVGAVLSAYIWETQIRDRVSVRRVMSPDDPDVDSILDLYQNLFPDDGTNYTADEFIEFIDGTSDFSDERHVRAENIFLIAKCRKEVVGFLLSSFYPQRRKAIIGYYGINKDIVEARRSATAKLLPKLKRILLDGSHPCDFVFFDLQGVDPTTPKKEAGDRKARPKRFRQSAKRLGLTAYQLQFPYACPKVSLNDETHEYPFTLMCVPVSAQLPRPVPRSLILEFLHFLHHDCYGDLYPVSDARFQPYHDHLDKRMRHYEQSLPGSISAI